MGGLLDAEGGAILLAVLSPLATPAGPDDAQPAARRRADALVELARRSLERGWLPDAGGERPHLVVTIDLPSLTAATGSPGADCDWTGPITAETARRIACDAGVSRVLLAGASQPVDVGRRTRVVSPGTRRALVVRDRGCVSPGCARPPAWTDAHHLVHWVDGGSTALDNLVLLCRGHRRLAHEGRWRLDRDPTNGCRSGRQDWPIRVSPAGQHLGSY